MMKLRWEAWKAGEQRGAFIVFTALAMWFLMMFVAFSVDFGNYYQHRSRLQNAADAAALAGVAEYTTEEIAANSVVGAVAAPTLSKGRLVTVVDNDKAAAAPDGVRRSAREYVQKNYGSIEIKDNKVWSEEVTNETTENGVTTSVKTTHRYCRVDLEDTVQTFFARIFGVDSLTVKVSALAMIDGSAVNETWGQRLAGIAERMELLAPDQYWESLINKSKTAFYITDKLNINDPSTRHMGYGEGQQRYYVVEGQKKEQLGKPEEIEHNDGTGIIIGYKEPKNGGICAEPIYAAAGIPWSNLKYHVQTKVFVLDDSIHVTHTDAGEIFALFLNRDHIAQRLGERDRFTKIVAKKMPKKSNASTPLYVRLEGEPIRMGAQALMTVNGVTIDVQLKDIGDERLEKECRPFVLAYDGPDMNRGKLALGKTDVQDAPFIATQQTVLALEDFEIQEKKADAYKGELDVEDGRYYRSYKPAEIHKEIEPLRMGNETQISGVSLKYIGTIPDTLVESALSTSAPIEVHIEEGCVLYGNIYAPRSKVTITGSGRIVGFIAAAQIKDDRIVSATAVTTELVSLPVLAAVIRDRNKGVYDYERNYVTAEYAIVFNRYEDFTDPKYYENYFDRDANGRLLYNNLNSNWH